MNIRGSRKRLRLSGSGGQVAIDPVVEEVKVAVIKVLSTWVLDPEYSSYLEKKT